MKALLLVVFMLLSITVFSQEKESKGDELGHSENINGMVADNSGVPLFGVNVIVKGTKRGTQTDASGHYKINAEKGNVLVFSFIGMHTQEKTVENDTSVINVILNENTEALKEVVINAEKISENEKARSYSSSIITSDKLLKGGYTNVIQALQGTIAGVTVVGDKVIIRGGATFLGLEPLYIVDGAPRDRSYVMNNININEVEKVEVIKSASQSLRYGPRAIGGVVVVTTKFYNNFLEGNIGYSNPNPKVHKYQGSLTIEESIKDKPYIIELSAANSVEEAYTIYLAQKDRYSDLPTYYLEVYDYFKKWNDRKYGLKILFNDATNNLDSPEQLKALAYQLEAAQEYQLAINIYNQVLRLLPEDLQSYRDLALIYKEIGLVQESTAILNSLKSSKGNSNNAVLQFSSIDDILKNDGIDSAYDVRIVADWNRYEANINLHVIDPTREICYYENPKTKQGGQLIQNMSQGFGPEEFTLKNAKIGSYFIMINYSLENQEEVTIPTYMKLTMFKNYGKPNETKEIKIIRLTKPRDKQIVAKLEM